MGRQSAAPAPLDRGSMGAAVGGQGHLEGYRLRTILPKYRPAGVVPGGLLMAWR